MSNGENRLFVDIGEDHVCLRGTWHGEPFELYWDQQEWIDDPSVVITIVSAVCAAQWNAEAFAKRLREIGKLGGEA